jgi:mannose-6-phosphate isomerase
VTASRALKARTVEKVWGRDALPAPFAAPPGRRIGEIWFDPPPELPELLVKYLFTSESLSVQVHPSDSDAPEGQRGKEECWLVLSAEPGARLAVGFRQDVSPEIMRAAARDGTIEDLLAWHAAAPGDFFYLPAGTVHAIGSGLALLEIQQNSDVTYRLYDYGRPRELHLDAAVAVAEGTPHAAGLRRRIAEHGHVRLADGPHFQLDPLDGAVLVGGEECEPGNCALAWAIAEVDLVRGSRAVIAQPL